jgi:hypothetical protein
MNLGEALVKAGILKVEQLKTAEEKASRENAATLIISLLELEYLTFKVFEKFVLSTMGIKSAIVSSHDLNPTLLTRVGSSLITSKLIFPISTRDDKDRKLLALGMVDPTDQKTIDKVEGLTGYKVIPILISLPDFKEALKKNQQRMPGLSEINLKPEAGPFELQLTQHSPAELAKQSQKVGAIRIDPEEVVGGKGRKFREEILAKLDLDPAEISLLPSATYNRDTLQTDIQKVSSKTLQRIYALSSDEIKLEALINLLISKGILNKQDILISSAVSMAFKGGAPK